MAQNNVLGKGKKSFVIVSITAIVLVILCIIGYAANPLHGDNKTAFDLVSGNKFFSKASDIEIISGAVRTYKNAGETHAYLQISYTDNNGQRISSCYKITNKSVTDILAELEQTNDPTESRSLRLNREMCLLKNELDYDKISEALHL